MIPSIAGDHGNHVSAVANVWRQFYDARQSQTERVRRDFEAFREQFALADDSSLAGAAWPQAADALDRAYDACTGQEDIAIVSELCTLVSRYIAIAVEKSMLQSAQCSAAYNA